MTFGVLPVLLRDTSQSRQKGVQAPGFFCDPTTFGDCVKANLYDSYTEWSEHERQFHRRGWICGLCSCTSKSEAFFLDHLRDSHARVFPEDQQQAMARLSERYTSSAQQCPLCTKPPVSNPICFQQQLARHLQQLSVSVLPCPESEQNKHATRDGESTESQQVVVIDNEARTSLKSISTNQRSSVMEGDKTLSEHSKPVDRLEVPEAENQPVAEAQIAKKLREMQSNERTLGPEHPSTVKGRNKLASTYWKRDQLEEAVELSEKVPPIKDTKAGENNSSAVTSMSNIAWSYKSQARILI
ncbi:hypothetical protein PENVUL_c036G09540 [Penicillium vulpinum]|uniref:C2H2-type domain-containing protein n=1 Tax=Penicillium vulpinum TaxID=29845 RepID=A0A1V6RNI6_9EURO|nr:hypothetical protein PENVUL_c036G09540 [Penicillium vulpinum]